MDLPQDIAKLVERYPSLRKAFETGIESNDGREQKLLSFILSHPDIEQIKGNPSKVLDTMDEFSTKCDFLISIGSHKANILSNLIEKEKPNVIVELGGYLGYSAILFADTMRRVHGVTQGIHVWSLELNSDFAAIAREIVELSGLTEMITFIVGPAEVSLRQLKEQGKVSEVDLLFLDHEEELYVPDFKVCEELKLLKRGSVIVADNVVRPGAPEYRTLVRSNPGLKSEGVRGLILPADLEDEMEISHVVN